MSLIGIVELILQQAQRSPEKIAVRAGEDTIDFRHLDGASNFLAHALIENGCRGSVAHFGSSGPSQVLSLLAAHKAGLAFTTIDDSLSLALQKDRLAVAGVDIVTSDASGIAPAQELGVGVVEVQEHHLAEPVSRKVDPETISHIRFTSGSTGRSRGVCLNHRHTERMSRVIDRFLPADAKDDFALLGQFWPLVMFRAMALGATLHCVDFGRVGLAETRTRIRQGKVKALFAYPQALRAVFDEGQQFPDIRYLHVSGDIMTAMDQRLFRASLAPGTTVHSSFGSTEFPWIAAELYKVGEGTARNPVPIGRSVFPEEVRLVRGDGTACEIGETGQIVVRSPDLPEGYLGDPERTQKFFQLNDGERVFLTGDMAHEQEDGRWYSAGRADDMIKVRSANVWPGEVERALETYPAVHEAAVTGAKSADGETCLAAFFTASENAEPAALRVFLRSRLPRTMVPSTFVRVSDLPKTATGKLIRSKLPEIPPLTTKQAKADRPRGRTEQSIAEVWKKMLKCENLDRDADFLDLGGDSLMAVRMLAQVEAKFGLRIPIDTLSLEGASIAALARWIDNDARAIRLVRLREGDGQRMVLLPVAGGHLSDYLRLVEVFRGQHDIIGLRPSGLSRGEEPETDMAKLSATMIGAIPAEDAAIDLLGYSFGALVAYEAARELLAARQWDGRLVLVDPPMDWHATFPTLRFLFRCLRAGDYVRFFGGLRHVFRVVPSYQAIDSAHLQAALSFNPDPLPSSVSTLIILSEQNAAHQFVRETWTELIGEDVDFRYVDATHTNLMRFPTVDTVAELIAEWLDGTS